MKWDNFLIARRTFYLGQITVAESMLTVIVGVANTLLLSHCQTVFLPLWMLLR